MDERVQVGELSVAASLHRFVEEEALPGSGVEPAAFWEGLGAIVHDVAPRTRELLARRDELQSQIDLEGVSDLVHLSGFLSDDRLRDTVHRAGCVAIPSLYEPFGIVALEALAGGAPLVVARTGGLAELIDGTGAGLLFEPGNAAELAT